jgi:hypothetical protein
VTRREDGAVRHQIILVIAVVLRIQHVPENLFVRHIEASESGKCEASKKRTCACKWNI